MGTVGIWDCGYLGLWALGTVDIGTVYIGTVGIVDSGYWGLWVLGTVGIGDCGYWGLWILGTVGIRFVSDPNDHSPE